jgi:hypothetical protein
MSCWPRARLVGVAALVLALGEPAHGHAAPAEPPEDAPAAEPVAPTAEPAAPADATLVDVVLPCGVRVMIAQDLTLPVAAIALAVETGTEDDPNDAPGLVHALAYHLLQGNREYAPSGIARAVHGNGGVTSLAIGPAQVRYESLVPASMMAEMIAAEASRLRAPTVSETLWKDTLRSARRDRARSWAVPAALRVSAHQADGLAHDGHVVSPALEGLSQRAVESHLAERFTYDRATLVVVAPDSPEVALVGVIAAFADLPATARRARDRTATPPPATSPRTTSIAGHGGTFVWALPPDAPGQAWADVVCGTLNRQKRAQTESTRVRARCAIDDDPRRGVMIVKTSGTDDPQALVRERMQRVRDDEGGHFAKERAVVVDRLRRQIATPLPLARHLARARQPGPAVDTPPVRAAAELLGPDALAASTGVPQQYEYLLDVGASTLAVEPAKSPKPASPPS